MALGVNVPLDSHEYMDGWMKRSIFFCGRVTRHYLVTRQVALPETNITPENRQSQKDIHFPTIDFQGRTVSFREGIDICRSLGVWSLTRSVKTRNYNQ